MLEIILIALGVMALLVVGFWLLTLFYLLKVTYEYDQDMGKVRDRFDLGDAPTKKT